MYSMHMGDGPSTPADRLARSTPISFVAGVNTPIISVHSARSVRQLVLSGSLSEAHGTMPPEGHACTRD